MTEPRWPANFAPIYCPCGALIGGYDTNEPPGTLVIRHGCGQVASLNPRWQLPEERPGFSLSAWGFQTPPPDVKAWAVDDDGPSAAVVSVPQNPEEK